MLNNQTWFVGWPSRAALESLPLDHVELRPSQFSLALSCKSRWLAHPTYYYHATVCSSLINCQFFRFTELIVKKHYEVSIHQQNCMLYTFGILFNLLAFFTIDSGLSVEGKNFYLKQFSNFSLFRNHSSRNKFCSIQQGVASLYHLSKFFFCLGGHSVLSKLKYLFHDFNLWVISIVCCEVLIYIVYLWNDCPEIMVSRNTSTLYHPGCGHGLKLEQKIGTEIGSILFRSGPIPCLLS